jgi:hypothetical protein
MSNNLVQDIKTDVSETYVPLFEGIIRDISLLIKQEFALVKHELNDKLVKAKLLLIAVLISLFFGLTGFILLFSGTAVFIASRYGEMFPGSSSVFLGLGLLVISFICGLVLSK